MHNGAGIVPLIIEWTQNCHHAARYPIGGDSQSVTSGVVSRIEVTAYVHGSTELLGMQIDAAINSAPFCPPLLSRRHS